MQRFVLPGKLPGMNEYTNACRSSPYLGHRMKKDAQYLVVLAIRKAHLKPVDGPVELSFCFNEPNRRRDLDNISGFAHKVIQDALVETGVLKGDGWKHIRGYHDTFYAVPFGEEPFIQVQIMR